MPQTAGEAAALAAGAEGAAAGGAGAQSAPVRAPLQPALVLVVVRPQSQEAGGRVCWRLLLLPAASQALEGSLGVVGW